MTRIRIFLYTILTIYLASPMIWKYTPLIQHQMLFLNNINTRINRNLSRPEDLEIKCARTLRLTNYEAGELNESTKIELGVWHILPQSSLPLCDTDLRTNRVSIDDKLAFADSRPIVLYAHGNGGNRAGNGGNYRGRLYLRLAYQLDCHIVTFDYRGYGDSTNLRPSSEGLCADARFMYLWLLRQPNVTKDRIIVWGHSLGTAVSVRTVADLHTDIKPAMLILEAPFDTMGNAVANHPCTAPFKFLPYFEYFFREPIENSPDLNFDSIGRIGDIKPAALMILHAEDDMVIPMKLGRNLYERALQLLGESEVRFVRVSADEGLGHKDICEHNESMAQVEQFIGDRMRT